MSTLLMPTRDKKSQTYSLDKKTNKVGISSENNYDVSVSRIGHQESLAFVIKKTHHKDYITEFFFEIQVNGKKYSPQRNKIELKHNDLITVPSKDLTFIYKNQYLQQLEEEQNKIQLLKIENRLGSTLDLSDHKSNVASTIEDFFSKANCEDMVKFSRSICHFIYKKYNGKIDRIIFYQVSFCENKWIPCFGIGPETKTSIPKLIIRELKETRRAVIFDSQEDAHDSSLSIVQKNISNCFCLPIFHTYIVNGKKEEKMNAILYFDKIKEDLYGESVAHKDNWEIGIKDFTEICSLLPGIGAIVSSLSKAQATSKREEKQANNIRKNLIYKNSTKEIIIRNNRSNVIPFYYFTKEGNDVFGFITGNRPFLNIELSSIATFVITNKIRYGEEENLAFNLNEFLEENIGKNIIKSIMIFSSIFDYNDNKECISAFQKGGGELLRITKENSTKMLEPLAGEEDSCEFNPEKGDVILAIPEGYTTSPYSKKIKEEIFKKRNNIRLINQEVSRFSSEIIVFKV